MCWCSCIGVVDVGVCIGVEDVIGVGRCIGVGNSIGVGICIGVVEVFV